MTSVSDTVAEYGMGYLFTHDLFSTDDLALVRQVVDRVYVLHRGRVVESSAVESVLDNPGDAYTRKPAESVPRSDGEWLRLGGAVRSGA